MKLGDAVSTELEKSLRQSGVRLVRFLLNDINSSTRGKASSIDTFSSRLTSGIGIVKGTMAQNILDQLQADSGFGATGEVRLVPDVSTLKVLPYLKSSALVLCDLMELDGRPWTLCPRNFLKRQIEDARSMGIDVQAALEPEFMLGIMVAGQFDPIERGLCFSTRSMNGADTFIDRLMTCLEAQNIEVEQYYAELGAGQHEMSIKHASALAAADRYLIFRETVYGVAQEMGLLATFVPKRAPSEPGNGCHLHLSLWDLEGKTNLMAAANGSDIADSSGTANSSGTADSAGTAGEAALSEMGRHFIAGILHHIKGLCALTCASINSYWRLKPRSWSSAYTCWGFDNREAAIRVPSTYWGHEAESTNIELKCMDNTANPYLALGAVIACGLDGIKRKLELPSPVQGDPSDLLPDEAAAAKVERLPGSLNEALTELEADLFLMRLLGPELANTFIVVKTSEIEALGSDASYEFATYLERY